MILLTPLIYLSSSKLILNYTCLYTSFIHSNTEYGEFILINYAYHTLVNWYTVQNVGI